MTGIIASDIDGVKVDYTNPFLRYHNRVYHTNLRYEDVFSHDMSQVLGLSKQETDRRLDEFMASPSFSEVLPMEGAVKAMRILTSKRRVQSITARPLQFKPATLQCLDQYFPPFEAVRFCEEYPELSEYPRRTRKVQFCKEVNPDYLIEDHAGNARDCSPHCGIIILIKHPWNRCESLPGNCIPVDTWTEVLKIIN